MYNICEKQTRETDLLKHYLFLYFMLKMIWTCIGKNNN